MMELIERLEKLTGPDREVDAEIWGLACDDTGPYPHYTASIDAALTLLGDRAGSIYFGDKTATVGLRGYGMISASTPAIALCIAALKARSS